MDFFLHILIVINFWMPVVLGYNLLFGKGKIFHFGPFGIWLATAYALYVPILQTQSYILGLICAIVTATLLSICFAWLSLRLQPDGMGVMSLAIHLVLIALVLNLTDITRGALGIPGIQRVSFLKTIESFAFVTTCASLAWIFIFYRIYHGSFGRKVSALAEQEWHGMSLGISRFAVHAVAFLLLGIATITPSFFQSQYLHILHPSDYHFPAFVFLVMIVVAGKPGSLWGGVFSTICLVTLREMLRFVPFSPAILGPVRLLLFGLILFVAVWLRRDTLFPKQRSI